MKDYNVFEYNILTGNLFSRHKDPGDPVIKDLTLKFARMLKMALFICRGIFNNQKGKKKSHCES